jgi:hypothetical protein
MACAAGLTGAMPKRRFGDQFSTGLPLTSPGQCGETIFLTMREWRAATVAGNDLVSRAGLAVIESDLRCSSFNDDSTSEGGKACRRSTRSWFSLGCSIAVRRWWRAELGFAAGI